MTTVEKVRAICNAKNIPVSRLEQDLAFSNGYLNPKKTKEIPSDRLAAIAAYFGIPMENIIIGQLEKPTAQGDGLTKSQQDIMRLVPSLSDAEIAKLLAYANGLLAGRKSPGGQG